MERTVWIGEWPRALPPSGPPLPTPTGSRRSDSPPPSPSTCCAAHCSPLSALDSAHGPSNHFSLATASTLRLIAPSTPAACGRAVTGGGAGAVIQKGRAGRGGIPCGASSCGGGRESALDPSLFRRGTCGGGVRTPPGTMRVSVSGGCGDSAEEGRYATALPSDHFSIPYGSSASTGVGGRGSASKPCSVAGGSAAGRRGGRIDGRVRVRTSALYTARHACLPTASCPNSAGRTPLPYRGPVAELVSG